MSDFDAQDDGTTVDDSGMPGMTDEDRKKLLAQQLVNQSPTSNNLGIPDAVYNFRQDQAAGAVDSSQPSPAVVQDQQHLGQRKDPYGYRDPYANITPPSLEPVPERNAASRLALAGRPGGILGVIGALAGNDKEIGAAMGRNATKEADFKNRLELAKDQATSQYARNLYGTGRPVVSPDKNSPSGYSYLHPTSGEVIGPAPDPATLHPQKPQAETILTQTDKIVGKPEDYSTPEEYGEAWTKTFADLSKAAHPQKPSGPAKSMYLQYEDDNGNVFTNDRSSNKWFDNQGNPLKGAPANIHRIGVKGGKPEQTPASIEGDNVAAAVKKNGGQPVDDDTLRGTKAGAAQVSRAKGLMPDQKPKKGPTVPNPGTAGGQTLHMNDGTTWTKDPVKGWVKVGG